MMFGWLRAEAARASCSKRRTSSSSRAKCAGSSFSATRRPSRASFARYTVPMPPAPIFSRMRYEPSLVRPGTTSSVACSPALLLRGVDFEEEDLEEDLGEDLDEDLGADFKSDALRGRVLSGESGADAGCSPVRTRTSTSRRSSSSPAQAS